MLAAALGVPATHSPYVQRIPLPAGDALLRGFAQDSVVVRLLGGAADAAVLPLTGLVGCRRVGCLYATSDVAGVRIGLIPAAVLDSLSRQAVAEAGPVGR